MAADGAASAEGDRLTLRSGAWKLERSSLKAMLVMDVSDEERDGVFREDRKSAWSLAATASKPKTAGGGLGAMVGSAGGRSMPGGGGGAGGEW